MTVTKFRRSRPQGNGRAVFVDGKRTAFVKSFGVFEDSSAVQLFSSVIDGLLRRIDLDPEELDECSAGVVVPQTKNPNVARDAILQLGLPRHIHGYSLNRACTSSLQTIADAAKTIHFGQPNLILAGGVELLSDVPIVYSDEARKFLVKLQKAKTPTAKLSILSQFSAKSWFPKPPDLAEPLTGLTMGQHAEIMAKKNHLSRRDQDDFALDSHSKAAAARENGIFEQEIVPIWSGKKFDTHVNEDNIIRTDSTSEAMAKLKPAFDRKFGTISAGNASPLTDGAAVSLIGDEQRCRDLGLQPKVAIKDMLFLGIDPEDQLLIGPALAIPMLLRRHGMTYGDIDLYEIHEAFAAQVLSCLQAMESSEFNADYFGEEPLGEFPRDRLNVNGGAIAIGHPFGATGSRLVTTLANELVRRDKNLGVIGVCAAGGMAGAMLLERI